VIGLFTLELGSHMASAVDSTEGEAASVGLGVTSNVVVDLIHCPLVGYIPAHISNPVLSSNSRYGSIGIARVVEHLVFTLKGLINPLRSLRLDSVVDLVSAQVPRLNISWDVEGSLHVILIQVGNERSSPGARRELVRSGTFLQPGGVVIGTPRVSLIKLLLRAI